ncbi:Hypothetical protein D9617_49g041260 [Elsinoe fawcettii]|nr:Hypothetical protein D9617_49g041260 [Elsinoe fawcettii]
MSSERELIRPLKRLMAKPLIGDEQISLLACGEDLREIVLAKLAEKKMPFTKHNRTSSGRSFVLVKVRTYQKKMATVEPARDEQSEVEDTDELGEFPTAEFWQFFYNLDSESRWKLLTEAIHSTQPVWRMKKGFMSFQKGKEVTFTVKSLVRNNNTITAILRPCPDSVENLVHMCEQKWEMEGSKSCAGFNSTGRTNMSLFQQVEIRLPGIQMAKMDADLTVNIDHGNYRENPQDRFKPADLQFFTTSLIGTTYV